MDKLNPERRSENMRRIRSKDMAPEVAVRRMVHALGFRFRLHRRDLPGKPDVVLTRLKKAIFVHGCFWHQHPDCREGRIPGTRQEYWRPKLARNVERDAQNETALRQLGWDTLTVWECDLKDATAVRERLTQFLGPHRRVTRRDSRSRAPLAGRARRAAGKK